jgi:hypothetical protein
MKSYLEINDVFRFFLMNLIKKIPLRYQSNETAYAFLRFDEIIGLGQRKQRMYT